jgi:L-cysteine/cystine lyase
MVDPFLPESQKVAALREALPATGAGMYLNTGSVGPLPAETVRAMREVEDRELAVGRASYEEWEAFEERIEEARGVLATVVRDGPDSMAITHGTTQAIDTALWATDPRPGDRLVTSSLEYPGVIGMLATLRDRYGGQLDFVDLDGAADDDAILERFDAAIRPGTQAVLVSHVSWATGALLPVAGIGRLAHDRGAWFIVDGAQSAGAMEVDARSTGADFYAFAGQKWLLGPEGLGALWVGPRGLSEGRQTYVGFASLGRIEMDGRIEAWPAARRFEVGGFHHPSLVGLARSVGWLAMYVGLPWAFERGGRLASRAVSGLAAVPGVELITPRDRRATLVTFRITGWPMAPIREQLSKRIFAMTRPVPHLDAVRISPGFFNTEDEIDRFVETVALLAKHTPATIPERPSLVIVQGPTS